jgi:hypothetical protein
MRKPLVIAVAELDGAIAELEGRPRPASLDALDPTAGSQAAPAATPGAGSAAAAGSAATTPAAASGQGSAATPTAAAGAATPTAAAGGAAPAVAASPSDRMKASAAILRAARERLIRIAEDRQSSEVLLAQLELKARSRGRSTEELGRDVNEQRSGLGALYAEIASDVAKAGDKTRAKRLLAIAAHLDPGNRARYEQQLRTFDKTASLPPDTGAAMGSGGTK